MNILAIDYGTKHIGLAWVDTGIGVVLPYGNVKNESRAKVIDLIKNEHIDEVVVGLPIGLDGKENENTKNVRLFVAELKKLLSVPVNVFDERFTSAAADRLGEGGASRDEKAAMILLESYIARKTV